MTNSVYSTLSRQSGLLDRFDAIANNIANISTTGFQREDVGFSEYVEKLGGNEPSLSLATADVRLVDTRQGALTRTGGTFDMAIDGPGYFLVSTPQGERLTRSGSFTADANGQLMDAAGNSLLDSGGSPILIPPQVKTVTLGPDGSLSADGTPVAQVGIYQPNTPQDLTYEAGTLFSAAGGVSPATGGSTIRQGYLEDSNVNPVQEIARMVDVQRAYELGQTFLNNEDQRVRSLIQTLSR